MKYIAVLVALLALAASGCQSIDAADSWFERHPPKEFHPSEISYEPAPDEAVPPDIGDPAGTAEPTPDIVAPVKIDHTEWRFTGTRKWTHIIIHHSATARGSAAMFDMSHRRRGWAGLGYDFVIGNGSGAGDGEVEIGPRWKKQGRGAHAGVNYYNEHGIGICLVGNFEKTSPTDRQITALVDLIRWLQKEYDIPRENVQGHRDIKDTLCPGKHFPMNKVRQLSRP